MRVLDSKDIETSRILRHYDYHELEKRLEEYVPELTKKLGMEGLVLFFPDRIKLEIYIYYHHPFTWERKTIVLEPSNLSFDLEKDSKMIRDTIEFRNEQESFQNICCYEAIRRRIKLEVREGSVLDEMEKEEKNDLR